MADSAARKRLAKPIAPHIAPEQPKLSALVEPRIVEPDTAATPPRPWPRKIAPDDVLVRTREVLRVLGVGRTTLHRMIHNKEFPAP
jgi:hypothetical protein